MTTHPLALAFGVFLATVSVSVPLAAAPATVSDGTGSDRELPAGIAVAQPVSLRQAVMVHEAYVRLGDLFDGAGEYADRTVLQSPEPGKRTTVDALWLYKVAHAYGLAWRPLGKNDRAVVERAGQLIERERVDAEIRNALAGNGLGADDEVTLTDRRLEIFVPTGAESTIAVENVSYDPRTRRFTCVVVTPAGAPDAKRTMVSGRVFATTELPVLKQIRRKGEVITAADISWARVHTEDVKHDAIADLDQLVGMTPVRVLKPGQPVRGDEVQRPLLVTKGMMVTMIVRTPFMTLTAQGKAQDDGAKNASIRVQNTNSNRTLIATVVDTNTVTVQPNGTTATY
ncbi:MAG: flagellar basal body P-ring formation chaperone FlgA [Alphaproteobacteria bacterium]